MSLLREIQNDATNSSVKVSDLLRKCKILAARLGSKEFQSWINKELNGYSLEDELPEYRVIEANSKGNFAGAFGSSLTNIDIPSICFDQEHHEDIHKSCLVGSISELETLVENSVKQGINLRQPWNSNFVVLFGRNIYRGYTCIQAWKEISPAQVQGIIDLIKTKILDFVLDIEMINPEAGEASLNAHPIPQEKVNQIFNINITGNVQNLASGNHQSTIHQTASNSKISEDFSNLLNELKKSDIENNVAQEVAIRIEKLGANVGKSEYANTYGELMSFVSNHVTVLGFLAPYLPMLSSYL
ncbi:hypothetical protein B9T23_14685 [Acinetobacter terrae]|uniref:AbiTii domain-containing protein n=1 Tax=Acinetobacter terrae TaxID=2731247 RepID=UPI000A330A2F|nr:hypothetical protein [Acinetobacter terrae]OTG72479.1 hypothetical protein B9T23_14685 [Acinetobacter terrae]